MLCLACEPCSLDHFLDQNKTQCPSKTCRCHQKFNLQLLILFWFQIVQPLIILSRCSEGDYIFTWKLKFFSQTSALLLLSFLNLINTLKFDFHLALNGDNARYLLRAQEAQNGKQLHSRVRSNLNCTVKKTVKKLIGKFL